MPRKFSIIFTFLLLFQLITPGLAAPVKTAAEGADIFAEKEAKVKDEDAEETSISVPWSIEGVEVEAGDKAVVDIPDTYEIKEIDEDKSSDDEDIIESQKVDGQEVTIIFNEKAEELEKADGKLVVNVVNLEVQEKLEKEKEATEKKEAEEKDEQEEKEKKQKEQEKKEKEEKESENNNDEVEDNDKEAEDNEGEEENAAENDSEKEKSAEKENDSTDEDESEENENNEEADEKADNDDSSEKDADEKKTTAKMQIANEGDNDDKHGFKLELGEILDLDDEAFDEQHPMDPHEEFKLRLEWQLEDGHNYEAGDTETFDLPKGIKIEKDIDIELTDESDQVVANAVVTPDKKVELTFTDFVETHSDVTGWMEIISELDTEEVEEEDGEIIIDPIGEEGELRVPIEKENKDKTIEKKGEPNKGYNADEINWEVIVNKNKTSLENAKVTDVLPDGTEFKEDSLKVTKLKVDLDGNVLGDGEEMDVSPEFGADEKLTVDLGDTNDAYRIEYVTEVTDDDKMDFKNNATIIDEELDDVSADSTVTINRGDPIKKSAVKDYDPKTGIIKWEIEFNYNQKDLSDVTLEDTWTPEGMLELVEDKLEFQEVSIDDDGNAHAEGEPVNVPDGAKLNEVTDGFEVTGISTDKAYKVTYQTKVKDRVLDPEDVSNTAGFGSESDGSGTHVGQFYGSKSAGKIDYAEKTIDWKIKVNQDEYPMENISIEDTLGEGLTLLEDSMKVTVDGESYEDYTLAGSNPFTIDFPEDYSTDKEIEITYKTEFDADNVPKHKPTNKAAITWTPEGEKDSITKEVKAETELNKETKDYSWKNGSYNPETKEITWEIIANYRENSIADLNIFDEPQGNQQIIDGSAEVKELSIASNGNMSEVDTIDGKASIDEDNNTLEVALGETNKAYKITYKTSLEGLDEMQDEYVNEAEVFDGDESLSEIDAKVGVVKDRKYGDKSGNQDGKQVHWSIDANLVQQKISDLKLVDKISDNQEYLEDSIKVYHADVDENGKASKGDEVSSDEYELEIDQDSGEFTVEWEDEVERAFIVEYSTLFFEEHGKDVRNDYAITGDSIEEDSDADDGYNVTIEQLGSGGGSGKAGYLVIDKVDTTDGNEEKLEGAEFDLIDPDTGNVLKSGVTDENGQIDFGRLLFGDYTLVETKVPEGLVTPDEEQTIALDKEYKSDDDKEGFEYTVENYEPVFAIELTKTDDEDSALEDAEFTLFDSDDKEIAKTTTDADGKILFEDLEEAGSYYVQETKAPAGYVLDETKHEVEVGDKEKEPVTVKIENKARGAVELTKTDEDTGEALEGVEFALQKENNSGSYDTIETFTTDNDGKVKTSNTLEAGKYQFVETEGLDDYRTNGTPVKFTVNVNSTDKQEFTMENEQYKGSVKLMKEDAATEKTLKGAEFKLMDSEGEVVEENLTTNIDGEIEVNDLFLGDYQLIETKAPEGYEKDDTPIDIEITEDNQVVEKTMINNKITDIPVEKKWNNDKGDTEPVTITLLPTDETIELNEGNNWKATFEDVDVYDEDGNEIDYEIEEGDVDGYNSEVTGDAEEGFIVTNTETTSVSGVKKWKDDGSDDRPDQITVKLFADGEKVATETADEDSDWKYDFKNLDKYNEDGEEIEYKIDEVEVDGYESDIDGFNIENVRVGTISVEGEKKWQDVDATERPDEITVDLSREVDGETDEDFSETTTVQPDNKGNWTYEFSDLDEFNDVGVAYKYIVEEADEPDKYKSEVDDHNITNVRTGETEVSGTKRWKDDTSEDRPEEITVNLLRNDVVVDKTEVTADDNWKYTFTELEKYDDEGQLYEYTVKEQDVEGYESKVSGADITNTRSETKDIEVNKSWLDDDSEERPDKVVVYLKQNDKNFDTAELRADNDWEYTFTDLEAFDEDGQAYSYSVEEKAIEGYEESIDGFDITNLRVGKTEVSGTKNWLDDDSEDRPEEITVNLLANGEETDESATVDADSDWTYEFTDLDKYDDKGKEIKYTVDEEEVEGYEKTIDGHDITNLRVGKTEVTGEKIWDEVDDRYRPDDITVGLLANGEEVDSMEVKEETDWTYEFTDLDKYDDKGKEIDYSIKESNIPEGYKSEVDGYEVTNTQKTTEISGEKSWDEVNEEYRPEKVEIQLLANGEPEKTKELRENNWEYEFTDLAKYDKDGEEINYTVEELDVPKGYDSEVDGFDITNTQESTEVSGEKTWNEVDDRYRPDTVEVQLFANKEEADTVYLSKDTDWEYEFADLAKYDKKGEEINYTVEELDVPKGYDSEVDGSDITNTQKTTDISGTKTWLDENKQDRPETIVVQVANDNEVVDKKEISSEDQEFTFENLPKYDKNGDKIEYTVDEEDDKIGGYKKSIDGSDITNVREGKTEVDMTKSWKDDDKADRPDSVKVNILQNGEKLDDEIHKITAEDDWKLTVEDLPKYDEEGRAYDYTVTEHDVPGYDSEVDGLDITNTRSDKKSLNVTKTWLDTKESAERPDSIEVNLFRSVEDDNWDEVKTLTLSAEDDWEYEVRDLPSFNKEGQAYTYEIEEEDVEGYESKVDGFDITNVRTDVTTVEGEKTWKKDEKADRPDSITVELLANDEKVDETKVKSDKAGEWQYAFEDLDKYDAEGKEIKYAVKEQNVKGYTSKVDGYNITNTKKDTAEKDKEKPSDESDDDKGSSSSDGDKGDPTESGSTGTSTDESTSSSIDKSKDDSADKSDGSALPKTATNIFSMLLIGTVLLALGFIIIAARRKKDA